MPKSEKKDIKIGRVKRAIKRERLCVCVCIVYTHLSNTEPYIS